MNRGSRDRLALSLLAEPGDQAAVADVAADGVAAAVRRRRTADLEPRVDEAIERARASGLRWVCPGDAEWPAALDDLDHVEPLHGTTGAPWGLWVRGTGHLATLAARSVAVVGARSCSSYGAEVAGELAADVADAGFTVVSGAAYGIDACAHRGAMVLQRPTIAVLACGADRAYPVAHTAMLDRIAAEGGVVVSEQAPGATPLKHRFLSRNRIIAGLAQATVVVEAATRSGSLNTLHWADLLGRSTMVVPGPVTSRRSDGSHAAVRAGKAVLVTCGSDVVADLAAVGFCDSGSAVP